MSKPVRSIKLVCTHGIRDDQPGFVERFRLITTIGGKTWVPTVQPHGRVQQLRGDELQAYPLEGEPPEDAPLRDRREFPCKCGRTLQLRDENLQALLTLAASEGRDTLRLDALL